MQSTDDFVMQSNRFSSAITSDAGVFVLALLVGIAAAVICAAVKQPDAALLLMLLAAMVFGFCRPRHAWRWAVALVAWVPIVALFRVPLVPNGVPMPWCNTVLPVRAPAGAALVALVVVPFVGVYLGAAIAWLVATAIRLFEPLVHRTLAWVQTTLRAVSIALLALIVLSAAFELAQPLQPYGLRDRYCWDEFCFSVQAVQRTKTLRAGHLSATAQGTFYVVTAKMEAPWWGRFDWGPDAVYVTDYDGTDYRYSVAGQRIADLQSKHATGCHQIPGATETETIVFDLPDAVVQPRLLVRDTLGFEGLLGGWRDSFYYVKPGFNLRYD